MSAYEPVVVQKPVFFTETVDGYYQIVIKGYEVDTLAPQPARSPDDGLKKL
jgi:hypothetical protein